MHAVRRLLEEWTEFRWSIPNVSKLIRPHPVTGAVRCLDVSPGFSSGVGCYRWRMLICADMQQHDLENGEEPDMGVYLCLDDDCDNTAREYQNGDVCPPELANGGKRDAQFEIQVSQSKRAETEKKTASL